jgi:hypothetical protein
MQNSMKKLLVIALALNVGIIVGHSSAGSKSRLTPICNLKIERSAYSLVYDGMHVQARYVYEFLILIEKKEWQLIFSNSPFMATKTIQL